MFNFTAPPPLSLYIHFPWCVRKCPYCDFNSHETRAEIPEHEYVDALIADLEQELPLVWGRHVTSIFMGGGTPSLFSPSAIDRLLGAIRARLPLRPGLEITLEANPGTVEAARLRELRAAGVNRLSIGVQSFDDAALRRLGRIHGATDAIYAAESAHSAGFYNFNLDLMYALPGQDVSGACADVAQAVALAPAHISHYQLTVEPNTAFGHAPPVLPDDDAGWDMQERCQALLAEAGYAPYEVSAYARAGWQCAHNLNYWTYGDYLGIGAGAHAKVTDAPRQRILRRWKVKHPRDYLTKATGAGRIGGESDVARQDVAFEFMMNALRLSEGFPVDLFAQHTGLPITAAGKALSRAQARGLIERNEQTVRPTALGRRFLNDVMEMFLAE